ncbi:MAG: DUF2851 family protein [Bacteroidales bacterium]|nr:DUF2851 family protein [Bacteroidales bacterium]
MREDLLYFIWKTKHFAINGKSTSEGELIEVIHPGEYNNDSGPDFFNAKIRIGKTLWAGNVEIHINSSDWYLHGHHDNPAYDNVILHIVVNDDKQTINSKGLSIPTIKTQYPDALEWELLNLTSSGRWIPCEEKFTSFDPLTTSIWLSNLLVERLEQKTNYVLNLVDEAHGSWEEAFYHSMARSFGLKTNALPFELLAKVTPLKVLSKHKNNLFQIEALLFGQSGLLPESGLCDEYSKSLSNEYKYLQHKFNLIPIQGHLWKFLRMRPTAFPTIRIAQFASLVHQSSSLFSKIIEIEEIEDIIRLIRVEPSVYWKTHYTFGKVSDEVNKRLGDDSISIIAINSIVPFVFAYGISRSNNALKEKAMRLLEEIKPENNNITKGFVDLGVSVKTAYDTQAMIQLKTCYCDPKKCLFCHLGARLLLKSVDFK